MSCVYFAGSGNTPTCVGKTLPPYPLPTTGRKHPHVRGEDTRGQDLKYPATETPPRAWGRRTDLSGLLSKMRNTPTCVGKTGKGFVGKRDEGKHPHVRGEDKLPIVLPYVSVETPPRAWGRLIVPSSSGSPLRNTPTCVGKTLRDYSLFLLSRQNNIETSSFSDTSCSPDNSMSWRFGSPMP